MSWAMRGSLQVSPPGGLCKTCTLALLLSFFLFSAASLCASSFSSCACWEENLLEERSEGDARGLDSRSGEK